MPTGAGLARPVGAGFSVCSSMVLNAPQLGQRPIHLGVSFPQFVQKKTVFIFAIFLILPLKCYFPAGEYYSNQFPCGQVSDRKLLTVAAITQHSLR